MMVRCTYRSYMICVILLYLIISSVKCFHLFICLERETIAVRWRFKEGKRISAKEKIIWMQNIFMCNSYVLTSTVFYIISSHSDQIMVGVKKNGWGENVMVRFN